MFNEIRFWILINIFLPIKAWWRFKITGTYIPDTKRNHEVLNYMIAVASNSTRKPETPLEHFFEEKLIKSYNEVIQKLTAQKRDTSLMTYDQMRSKLAAHIIKSMLSYKWIEG